MTFSQFIQSRDFKIRFKTDTFPFFLALIDSVGIPQSKQTKSTSGSYALAISQNKQNYERKIVNIFSPSVSAFVVSAK